MICFSWRNAVAVASVLLWYVVSIAHAETYSYDHVTCRLPVSDRNRNYYLARLGLSTVACIRYGSIRNSSDGGATVLAMSCERNNDGTSQLILRPDMTETCVRGINEGNACNILSAELDPDTHIHRRDNLRLTGQDAATVERQQLDQVYVVERSFICTQSFGDSRTVVPSSLARRCDKGNLRTPNVEDDALYISTPLYDCSKVTLHLDL